MGNPAEKTCCHPDKNWFNQLLKERAIYTGKPTNGASISKLASGGYWEIPRLSRALKFPDAPARFEERTGPMPECPVNSGVS
jgi:hypothetical protein